MNYHPDMPPYGGRRPSEIPAAVITSALTSAAVTVAVLFVTGNLEIRLSAEEEAAPPPAETEKEETRQVPALTGLTAEVAKDVLRARELRLVVQGRQPDSSVKEGQIAKQDPLAKSEIPVNAAVTVIVSSGVKQVTVPDLVGKSADEAEKLSAAASLKIKEISRTGQCAPAVVCETLPPAGIAVDEGAAITLIVAPALTVPDVTGRYLGKAKAEIQKAGLKVGKIRWRSNDYKDANIVLSQEPPAGTVASPGDEINLFVNEE